MMDKLARDFYHIREKRKKSVSHKAAIRVLAPFTHTLTRKQHELFMSREMASREINENLINLIMANKPTMAGRPPAASLAETWMPSTVQQTATVLKNYTNSSEPGKTVSAYVAYSKKIVYTSDLLGNHNFPLGLGWKDSTRKAALVVPILTPENRVAIVIELTKDVEGSSYSWTDALAALSIGSWIGAAVHHRQQISIVNRKHQICTYLHEIITQSALLAVPLHMIISQIMNFAKYSIGADKTSFVLLENGNNETFMVMYNECSDSNQHCREEKIQCREYQRAKGYCSRPPRAVSAVVGGMTLDVSENQGNAGDLCPLRGRPSRRLQGLPERSRPGQPRRNVLFELVLLVPTVQTTMRAQIPDFLVKFIAEFKTLANGLISADSGMLTAFIQTTFSEDGDSVPARVLRTGTVMNVVEKMSDTTTSVLAVPVTTDKNVGFAHLPVPLTLPPTRTPPFYRLLRAESEIQPSDLHLLETGKAA
ncbi:hypothetical protein AAG570_010753 [Ranatra chinensis]|uniref:GAF domain-containing protein n=1 Tax=Ranatra chinensis TaxID=642074 RepID=A0ABD0YNZ9_9HEMI